eukprot:CAMPEP_0119154530 /NCGR_PEP_ID=MMETSP1310-20130426/50930_1 /TAXON_ID=464262 /ORGANISM="Genus nov. species nov., Strain RCC2339" /LENGTH=78 /DNA_ID=CAMNT_0007147065 /DNA_START=63 /DNA_END=296 /DNA_ORIENTATION=+
MRLKAELQGAQEMCKEHASDAARLLRDLQREQTARSRLVAENKAYGERNRQLSAILEQKDRMVVELRGDVSRMRGTLG